MQGRSAREQAMNAARRATMVKSTFASIRHLLNGDDFMTAQDEDSAFRSFLTDATHAQENNEDENPFKFIDQQSTNNELAAFRESGSEDESIDEFVEPFLTDDFQASFNAFSPQSSIVIGDQSTGDSSCKGFRSSNDDFGFDEVHFNNDFGKEVEIQSIATHESSKSSKDRSLKDRFSKKMNSSSTRLRRRSDSDNVSATENTEVSSGSSSMKKSIASSNSASRRILKVENNEDINTARSRKIPGDGALPTNPPARRRKSSSGSELFSPRKSDRSTNQSDLQTSLTPRKSSKKSPEKPAKKEELNTRSIDMLKALAMELTKKSNNDDDELDATLLTDRVVTRIKELQASRVTKESTTSTSSRSRSRGRSEKFERDSRNNNNSLDDATSLKDKQSRSRSKSRPRMKQLPMTPTIKKQSKANDSSTRLSSSKASSSEDIQLLMKKKASKSKIGKEEQSAQPKNLLNEIISPKAKSPRKKSNLDVPRSPPVALLDEIKTTKKSLKSCSKSKSKEAVSSRPKPAAERSDDDIIEMLANLINQQLLAKD